MLRFWSFFYLAAGILFLVFLRSLHVPLEIDNGLEMGLRQKSVHNNPIFDTYSETILEYTFDYEKLFKKFNLKESSFFGLPFVASVYKTKHIFRSLSDFVWAIKMNNLKAENVKCGDILFIKTDYIKEFLEKIHPAIKYPYILITHESDYAVGYPWQLEYLKVDSKIITWYGQNIIASHSKLKPIPIGIVPPEGEKFSTIYKSAAQKNVPFYSRKLLLYSSFSKNTNINRTQTLNYFATTFANNPLVKINQGKIKWKEYLRNLGNAQFVLSPPGNGIDCHRTWEALAMGSIPIVLKNYLQPLYKNMPVMVVSSWEEVTEKSLAKFKTEKLKNGIPLRPNIWLRFWIKEIVGAKQNYIKNYC